MALARLATCTVYRQQGQGRLPWRIRLSEGLGTAVRLLFICVLLQIFLYEARADLVSLLHRITIAWKRHIGWV